MQAGLKVGEIMPVAPDGCELADKFVLSGKSSCLECPFLECEYRHTIESVREKITPEYIKALAGAGVGVAQIAVLAGKSERTVQRRLCRAGS